MIYHDTEVIPWRHSVILNRRHVNECGVKWVKRCCACFQMCKERAVRCSPLVWKCLASSSQAFIFAVLLVKFISVLSNNSGFPSIMATNSSSLSLVHGAAILPHTPRLLQHLTRAQPLPQKGPYESHNRKCKPLIANQLPVRNGWSPNPPWLPYQSALRRE